MQQFITSQQGNNTIQQKQNVQTDNYPNSIPQQQTRQFENNQPPTNTNSSPDMSKEQHIDELLNMVVQRGGSDLHLTYNLPPTIRILEVLHPIENASPASDSDLSRYLKQVIKTEEQLKRFLQERELDFSYTLKNTARFRVNAFYASGKIAMAFRLIPIEVPNLDTLNLPNQIQQFGEKPQGLVLVTGPTGVGKSSTLAALINWINEHRNRHIITIEDPIEYMFKSNKSLIQQREMNIDTKAWSKALRASLRQDPDVILIGEMRDRETIQTALTAAETGHLVFATLHTNSATQTVDRIIGVFPEYNQDQIKLQLSAVLEGVVSQQLVRSADGKTRYPAVEILIASPAVRNTIREGKTHYLDNVISTSYDEGMISMARSLGNLVAEGKVELNEALGKSLHQEEVIRYANSPNTRPLPNANGGASGQQDSN